MNFTKKQRKEFDKLVRPLIKFLNDSCHPHVVVVIDNESAELSEGMYCFRTREYLKD